MLLQVSRKFHVQSLLTHFSSPQVSREFSFGTGSEVTHADAAGGITSQGGLDNPFMELAQMESTGQQQQRAVTSSAETQQQVVGSTSSAEQCRYIPRKQAVWSHYSICPGGVSVLVYLSVCPPVFFLSLELLSVKRF